MVNRVALSLSGWAGSADDKASAFALPVGPAQLAAIALALFLAASTTGPAGAMVANLTPPQLHGTAFATLTVANNALGLAAGPILTGQLADQWGLLGAFQLLPVASLAAAAAFWIGRGSYAAKLAPDPGPTPKTA